MKVDRLLTHSGATFSPCKRYRYRLWRKWDDSKPTIAFVMLNPSTADEYTNDPTVHRCMLRAHRLGFGTMLVVNLFAWRSTDPDVLSHLEDPVGEDNDRAILDACLEADRVVCAWGRDGRILGRGARVVEMLTAIERPSLTSLNRLRLSCLGVNADGSPKHPLYLANSVELRPFP